MVETYDATRPRPVEAEIQSRIWTAIIITSLAAGITGAVIRHIFDDDRAATTPNAVDRTPGIDTTAPRNNNNTTTPRNAPPTDAPLPGER